MIHDTIAVVVDVVTDLGHARVGIRVGVVAVPAARHVVVRLTAGFHDVEIIAVAVSITIEVPGEGDMLVDVPVAVVVDAVAVFFGARVDGSVAIVAVLILGHTVSISVDDLVVRVFLKPSVELDLSQIAAGQSNSDQQSGETDSQQFMARHHVSPL